MEKQKTTVEELAAQEWFQDYCLKQDVQSIEAWEEYWKIHNQEQLIVEEAQKLVHLLALEPSRSTIATEWNHLIKNKPTRKVTKVRTLSFQLRLAAAVIAFAIAAFGAWQMLQPDWQEVQTAFGESKTIQLSDGSTIKLNANSSVRFQENWKWSKTRSVHLKGEAYFEVDKDDKSFVVQTKKGVIWVLGTTFNVEQRANALGVTLVEGKVKLAIPSHEALEMKPETYVYLDVDGKIIYQKADLKTELAWIDDKMAFSKVKIQEIVHQFKAEFNIDLQVKVDTLLERKVSATIPENNPELLLQALGEIYNLQVKKIDDNTYSLE
ncbi:MAG: FecR domain-containing protein [Bacteroidota bacterium]